MSLTARTPPVGAISDVEKVACLVVCAVSALCCVAVIVFNTKFPVLRQPPGRYVPLAALRRVEARGVR